MVQVRTLKEFDCPPKKVCSDCKKEFCVYNFGVAYMLKSGTKIYNSSCKPCKSRQRRDVARAKKLIGVAPPIGTPCSACHKPQSKRLCCDHDHKTGQFRGWLCNKCNKALGMLNEDKDSVVQLLEYLHDAEDGDGCGERAFSNVRQSRLTSFVHRSKEARDQSDEGASEGVCPEARRETGLYGNSAEQGQVGC